MTRARRGVATLAGALVAFATLAAGVPALGAPKPRPYTGFGATLAAFRAAHPEDAGRCPTTTCYGPLVPSLPPTYEFSYLTFEKGRVVGYSQALPRGTPLLQAELRVAELFPADAKMSDVEVVHRDQYGASCAVVNVESRQISHLFGKRAFGNDGGNVGVELATLTASGKTTYNPRAIDLAIVMPSYAGGDINC
ncbi:MAG TPA: hypothetical protein VMV02_07995 [Acidimicrobiales bacterium]|nr:hypothetical protein [Acidimicrobiales bacterium]